VDDDTLGNDPKNDIERSSATTLVCFPSINSKRPTSDQMMHPTMDHSRFDDESFTIVIDNACSFCVTNDVRHYVGTPEDVSVPVKGIGGIQIKATKKGTVKWSFTNDQGQVRDEYIPNTYFHENSPYCLYSPQHVAQIANDNYPIKNGTMYTGNAEEIVLIWDQ
jgi:hypothetical protein